MGRPPKSPIYVLPYGIEVIGEYPPDKANKYWRVRIRPHQLFPDVVERNGGCDIRRSRVVMTSKLGRALLPQEIVHHRNEDKTDDAPENLSLETTSSHNTHHKTGTTHTAETKEKTSQTLTSCYAAGARRRTSIASRNDQGQIQWTT